MRFDLAALARAAGQKRKTIALTVITPTAVLEQQLAAAYMEVVRAWAVAARDDILPAYRAGIATAKHHAVLTGDVVVADDVGGSEVEGANADAQVSRLLLTLTPKLRRWVVRAESWHRARWASSVQPTGVNLSTIIGPADAQITMDAAVQANVALVRSVSDEARARIQGAVFRGFTRRASAYDIAKEISDGLAISRRRALRIAANETKKLSALLSEERQRQAGITDYKWRHSMKLHPRIEHVERDGKIFSWSNSPADGPPGTLINCSCVAQAWLVLQED